MEEIADRTAWQDFCLLYYDQAMSSARYHLNKMKRSSAHWDERIDEDMVVEDAVVDGLQKAFIKYDPSRGASLTTFLSHVVHNELADAVEREMKSISTLNEINAHQEADYTFKEMSSRIPESAMENLKEKLRAAILRLPAVDQSILGFFLDDPKTFIEKSVEALGVTPGFVSVHKKRALYILPSLMEMDSSDYFDLYEEHTFAGVGQKTERKIISYTNPVCPQFDLEATVSKLFKILS